jgi:hypothetical protein
MTTVTAMEKKKRSMGTDMMKKKRKVKGTDMNMERSMGMERRVKLTSTTIRKATSMTRCLRDMNTSTIINSA